jgi:hypothetical protein
MEMDCSTKPDMDWCYNILLNPLSSKQVVQFSPCRSTSSDASVHLNHFTKTITNDVIWIIEVHTLK